MKNYIPSYDLPEMFSDIIIKRDVQAGIDLCNEIFEMFPKEYDSIPIIILEGIREASKNLIDLLFVDYLLNYLHIKYLDYIFTQF